MAPRGEGNKEQAAQNPDPHRQRHKQLLHLLRRFRAEALHHILVERRHRREHQQRRQRMEEIDHPHPVILPLLRRNCLPAWSVYDPQPPKRGEPIPDLAPGVPEAVREAEKEAGGSAADQETEGKRVAYSAAALPLVRESRRKNLERQNRPRGEEIR